jgi:hypothetical protein
MPGLGLAVDAFDPAAVLGGQAARALGPACPLAAGAKQRGMVLGEQDRAPLHPRADAGGAQRPRPAADRQVRLSFAQQPTIVDDPEQEPGEHQAHRDLGGDPRAAVVGAIAVGDLRRQPREVEDPVHPDQNVVVGTKSPSDPRRTAPPACARPSPTC